MNYLYEMQQYSQSRDVAEKAFDIVSKYYQHLEKASPDFSYMIY